MVWGFCVYFVYMIPLETDVLRKHRFQKIIVKINRCKELAHRMDHSTPKKCNLCPHPLQPTRDDCAAPVAVL